MCKFVLRRFKVVMREKSNCPTQLHSIQAERKRRTLLKQERKSEKGKTVEEGV